MKERSGAKVKLTSYEELLGVSSDEGSVEIELSKIKEFEKHPFKVLDDEKMDELVKSILENGVLSPVLVRPCESGDYEMISGHRRKHAAMIAGLNKIPAIVRDMTDEEAIIAMVDANIQREEILPSEKAFAYRMKMEAMKKQGARSDQISCQNDTKLNEGGTSCQNGAKSGEGRTSRQNGTKFRTDKLIADETGDSARQIQRYIRLTELLPEFLEMVDNKKLKFVLAVEISYLDKKVQKWVLNYWTERGTLQMKQIKHLRQYLADNKMISQYKLVDVLNEEIREQKSAKIISIPEEKVQKFFPASFSKEQKEKLIVMLLERWSAEGESV